MEVTKRNLRELSSIFEREIDVFICCASFEERCFSVAQNISSDKIRRVLVAKNERLNVHVDKNASQLIAMYGKNAVEMTFDNNDPLFTADNFQRNLQDERVTKASSVLVDITTFTHESLLILLKLLPLCIEQPTCVKFVYTSAESYASGLNNAEKWLSKGVADVRSVLGYSGRILPSRKTYLLILFGYEHERARKLIEILEPSRISLGFGKTGTEISKKNQEAHEFYHQLLYNSVAKYAKVGSFVFSCSNPWDTRDAIVAEIEESSGYNVVVAPMNTKISTVGTALATLENDSIQLCYAQAMLYNFKAYSTPGDECYIFELPELFAKQGM